MYFYEKLSDVIVWGNVKFISQKVNLVAFAIQLSILSQGQ